MSADTATTQRGDRISPGNTTIARLPHRRDSLGRQIINSNNTKTICGCLLSAHRVIHSERSQIFPVAGFRAALKHSAVIANA